MDKKNQSCNVSSLYITKDTWNYFPIRLREEIKGIFGNLPEDSVENILFQLNKRAEHLLARDFQRYSEKVFRGSPENNCIRKGVGWKNIRRN